MVNLAIAVECSKHPASRAEYFVWFLEIDETGEVIGLGKKSKNELMEDLFKQIATTGQSGWSAFLKNYSHAIQLYPHDFMSQNTFENTHFGNLPTLVEFQKTLSLLKKQLKVRIPAF